MTTDPFLNLAESRTTHLRELDIHMTALDLDRVSLDDIQGEIPELESAMVVYRRLVKLPTTNGSGATPAATKPRATRSAPGPKAPKGTRRVRRPRRDAEPPSFKEFALTHLDAVSLLAGDDDPTIAKGAAG